MILFRARGDKAGGHKALPETEPKHSTSRREKERIHLSYSVPLIVFRFLMSLLIEGIAVMCFKTYPPAFSFGTQYDGLISKY